MLIDVVVIVTAIRQAQSSQAATRAGKQLICECVLVTSLQKVCRLHSLVCAWIRLGVQCTPYAEQEQSSFLSNTWSSRPLSVNFDGFRKSYVCVLVRHIILVTRQTLHRVLHIARCAPYEHSAWGVPRGLFAGA